MSSSTSLGRDPYPSLDRSGHELIPYQKRTRDASEIVSESQGSCQAGAMTTRTTSSVIFLQNVSNISGSVVSLSNRRLVLKNGSPKTNRKQTHHLGAKKKNHGHSLVSYALLSRSASVSIALISSFAIVFMFVSTLDGLMERRWSTFAQ